MLSNTTWCLMPKPDGNKVKFIQRQKPLVPFFALLWKWKCCTVLIKIVAAVKLMLISYNWGNFLISNLLIGCLHTCPSLCRNLISNGITVQLRPKQCLLARQTSKISQSEYERSKKGTWLDKSFCHSQQQTNQLFVKTQPTAPNSFSSKEDDWTSQNSNN